MQDATTIQAKFSALTGPLKAKLPERDATFLGQLSDSISRWGWTEGRERVIAAMYDRVTRETVPTSTVDVSAIVDLFKVAGARLRYPAITLKPEETTYPIRISLAGPKAREPGTIWITSIDRGYDGRRAYYGKITPQGSWVPSQSILRMGDQDKLAAFLAMFAVNPARVAGRHGHLTGRCCFCNRALSDQDRSTKVGFGETCAKHWGIHQMWRDAAKEAVYGEAA